jgi:hypothetical protein
MLDIKRFDFEKHKQDLVEELIQNKLISDEVNKEKLKHVFFGTNELYLSPKSINVVLFTGHIGAGKNYIAKELANELHNLGFNVKISSFSLNLKQIVFKLYGLLKNGTHIKKDFIDYDEVKNFTNFLVNTYYELFLSPIRNQHFIDSDELKDFQKYIKTKVEPKIIELGNWIKENYSTNPKLTTRKTLQQFGTEIVRNLIDKFFWTNLLFYKELYTSSIKNIKSLPDFLFITDWRFPNEEIYFRNQLYLKSNLFTINGYLYNIYKHLLGNSLIRIKIVSSPDIVYKRLGIDKIEYLKMLEHVSEKEMSNLKVDVEVIND